MKLLPIPDAAGKVVRWINAEHLVSVTRIQINDDTEVLLFAELKITGMPLERITLGIHHGVEAADAAWSKFIGDLAE